MADDLRIVQKWRLTPTTTPKPTTPPSETELAEVHGREPVPPELRPSLDQLAPPAPKVSAPPPAPDLPTVVQKFRIELPKVAPPDLRRTEPYTPSTPIDVGLDPKLAGMMIRSAPPPTVRVETDPKAVYEQLGKLAPPPKPVKVETHPSILAVELDLAKAIPKLPPKTTLSPWATRALASGKLDRRARQELARAAIGEPLTARDVLDDLGSFGTIGLVRDYLRAREARRAASALAKDPTGPESPLWREVLREYEQEERRRFIRGQRPTTFGYEVFSALPTMLEWMALFAATGGLSALTIGQTLGSRLALRVAAGQLSQEAAERILTRAILTGQAGGVFTVGTALELGSLRERRAAPQYDPSVDDLVIRPRPTLIEDASRLALKTAIETATEYTGGPVSTGAAAVLRKLGAEDILAGARRMLRAIWLRGDPARTPRMFAALERHFGYHGVWPELAEERLNRIAHGLSAILWPDYRELVGSIPPEIRAVTGEPREAEPLPRPAPARRTLTGRPLEAAPAEADRTRPPLLGDVLRREFERRLEPLQELGRDMLVELALFSIPTVAVELTDASRRIARRLWANREQPEPIRIDPRPEPTAPVEPAAPPTAAEQRQVVRPDRPVFTEAEREEVRRRLAEAERLVSLQGRELTAEDVRRIEDSIRTHPEPGSSAWLTAWMVRPPGDLTAQPAEPEAPAAPPMVEEPPTVAPPTVDVTPTVTPVAEPATGPAAQVAPPLEVPPTTPVAEPATAPPAPKLPPPPNRVPPEIEQFILDHPGYGVDGQTLRQLGLEYITTDSFHYELYLDDVANGRVRPPSAPIEAAPTAPSEPVPVEPSATDETDEARIQALQDALALAVVAGDTARVEALQAELQALQARLLTEATLQPTPDTPAAEPAAPPAATGLDDLLAELAEVRTETHERVQLELATATPGETPPSLVWLTEEHRPASRYFARLREIFESPAARAAYLARTDRATQLLDLSLIEAWLQVHPEDGAARDAKAHLDAALGRTDQPPPETPPVEDVVTAVTPTLIADDPAGPDLAADFERDLADLLAGLDDTTPQAMLIDTGHPVPDEAAARAALASRRDLDRALTDLVAAWPGPVRLARPEPQRLTIELSGRPVSADTLEALARQQPAVVAELDLTDRLSRLGATRIEVTARSEAQTAWVTLDTRLPREARVVARRPRRPEEPFGLRIEADFGSRVVRAEAAGFWLSRQGHYLATPRVTVAGGVAAYWTSAPRPRLAGRASVGPVDLEVWIKPPTPGAPLPSDEAAVLIDGVFALALPIEGLAPDRLMAIPDPVIRVTGPRAEILTDDGTALRPPIQRMVTHLIDRALEAHANDLFAWRQQLYERLPTVAIAPGRVVALWDPRGRFLPEELRAIADPIKAVAIAVDRLAVRLVAAGREAGLRLRYPLQSIGWILDPRVAGMTLPHPSGTRARVLLNPFAFIRPTLTAGRLVSSTYYTIAHEVSHLFEPPAGLAPGEALAAVTRRILGRLSPSELAEAYNDLAVAYTGRSAEAVDDPPEVIHVRPTDPDLDFVAHFGLARGVARALQSYSRVLGDRPGTRDDLVAEGLVAFPSVVDDEGERPGAGPGPEGAGAGVSGEPAAAPPREVALSVLVELARRRGTTLEAQIKRAWAAGYRVRLNNGTLLEPPAPGATAAPPTTPTAPAEATAAPTATAPPTAEAPPQVPIEPAATRASEPLSFVIPDEPEPERPWTQRLEANLRAIRLLVQLRRQQRPATADEQMILAEYSGWGPLELAEVVGPTGRARQAAQVAAREELEVLLSPEELETLGDGAPTQFYTTAEVAHAVWRAVARLGFKGGVILEPAIGVGRFFGTMPREILGHPRTRLIGIDRDAVAAGIAKQLYQRAAVFATPLERASLPDGMADLVITNVPFGRVRVFDPAFLGPERRPLAGSLHGYFLAKSLDLVRPGGLVVTIASHFLLDSRSDVLRRYLATHADLVAAVRLPREAFRATGTAVTADILIFQKREAPRPAEAGRPTWVETDSINQGAAYRNRIFTEHPEWILGTEQIGRGLYSGREYLVTLDRPETLPQRLDALWASLPTDIVREPALEAPKPADIVRTAGPTRDPIGQFQLDEDGRVVVVTPAGREPVPVAYEPRIRAYIGLREAFVRVIRVMQENGSDEELAAAQAELQRAYMNFSGRFGLLASRTNRRALQEDPDYARVSGLEELVYVRERPGAPAVPKLKRLADIFTKRTIRVARPPDRFERPVDALVSSLVWRGEIDPDYIAEKMGQPWEAVAQALVEAGEIFRDPSTLRWVPAEEYLSGDVVGKLRQAEAAAMLDPQFKPNVAALKAVQPPRLEADQIEPLLGSTWIPLEIYQQWLREETGDINAAITLVSTEQIMRFQIHARFPSPVMPHYVRSINEWFEWAFHGEQPIIYVKVGDSRVRDEARTEEVRESLNELRERWNRWWRSHPEVQAEIVDLYNELFNRHVDYQPTGEGLELPGANPAIQLRPWQKRAIWRKLRGGNLALFHTPGSGKTYSMAAMAMEMRRLGLANKPALVVPKSVVADTVRQVTELYPGIKMLVTTPEDFKPKNRRRLLARIATNDWDLVVLAQTQFIKFDLTEETLTEFIRAQERSLIDALLGSDETMTREDIEDMVTRQRPPRSQSEKSIIMQIQRLRTMLHERLAKLRAKTDPIYFEHSGIDALFIDEAHDYKNLYFYTARKNIAGLKPDHADRAMDTYIKVRLVSEWSNHRNVVLSTGTPITNAMAEIYTMFRLIAQPTLDRLGLSNFDAWANAFALVREVIQPDPAGRYRTQLRLSDWRNLKTLRQLVARHADILTDEDYRASGLVTLPAIAGGRPTVISQDPNPLFTAFIADLRRRLHDVRHRLVDPSTDNLLKITQHASSGAVDLRLLYPQAPPEASPRLARAADEIAKRYRETTGIRGTQLVFLDIGTPHRREPLPPTVLGTTEIEDRELESEDLLTEADETTVEDEPVEVTEDELDEALELPPSATTDVLAEEEPSLAALGPMRTEGRPFDLYSELKRLLVERGIPADEIVALHQAKSTTERAQLYQAVRDGRVRVLMMTRKMGGLGINVQTRVVAVHHLDVPWAPHLMVQSEARAIRQGNLNPEVEILRYVTTRSFDEYRWGLLSIKQEMIAKFFKGEIDQLEDLDPRVIDFQTAQALASGDPRVLRMVELERLVRRLEARERNWRDSIEVARQRAAMAQARIDRLLAKAARLEGALETVRTWWKESRPVTVFWKATPGGAVRLRQGESDRLMLETREGRDAFSDLFGRVALSLTWSAEVRFATIGDLVVSFRAHDGGVIAVQVQIPGDIVLSSSFVSNDGRTLTMTNPTAFLFQVLHERFIGREIAKAREAIESARRELAVAAGHTEDFPGQAELDAARAELDEIRRALGIQPHAAPHPADPTVAGLIDALAQTEREVDRLSRGAESAAPDPWRLRDDPSPDPPLRRRAHYARSRALARQAMSTLPQSPNQVVRLSDRLGLPPRWPHEVSPVGLAFDPTRIRWMGSITWRGIRVRNALDLARAAQMVRNPRFETLWYLYGKRQPDGSVVILGSEAISSRLPDATDSVVASKAFLRFERDLYARYGSDQSRWPVDVVEAWHRAYRLDVARFAASQRSRMRRLGADVWFAVHNHPSGYARPSLSDTTLTMIMADRLAPMEFGGHLVVNDGEWGWIAPDGTVTTDYIEPPIDIYRSAIPHPLLHYAVRRPQDLMAMVGPSLRIRGPGSVMLVFLTAHFEVRALEPVMASQLRDPQVEAFLRNRSSAYGGPHVVAFMDASDFDMAIPLVELGVLLDAVAVASDRPRALTTAALRLFGRGPFPHVRHESRVVGYRVREEPPEIAFARTEGGIRIAMGNEGRAIRTMAGALYSAERPKIIARELLQNAVDAVRGRPDATVEVRFHEGEHWIEVQDNGPGMTRRELETVFTDVFETGKAGQASSGQFGVGKAVFLVGAERTEFETVAVEPDGRRVRYRGGGTPEEFSQHVELFREEVGPEVPTGTRIRTYLKPDDDLYGPWRTTRRLIRSSFLLPVEFRITRWWLGGGLPPDDERFDRDRRSQHRVLLRETLSLPGAEIDVYELALDPGETVPLLYAVLNHGYGQFEHFLPAGVHDYLEGAVVVDVRSTVDASDPNYPFALNRQELHDTVVDAIANRLQAIADTRRQARAAALAQAYDALPTVRVSPVSPQQHGYTLPVADVGARLTPDEFATIFNDPDVQRLLNAIVEAGERVLEAAQRSRLGQTLSVTLTSTVRVGVVLSDRLDGLFLRRPGSQDRATILVNPFEYLLSPSVRDAERASYAASGVLHALLHETTHYFEGPHNERFTTILNHLTASLGADQAIRSLYAIMEAYGGAAGLAPGIARALERYQESRGRPARADDALIRAGVSLPRPADPTEGEAGPDPAVRRDRGRVEHPELLATQRRIVRQLVERYRAYGLNFSAALWQFQRDGGRLAKDLSDLFAAEWDATIEPLPAAKIAPPDLPPASPDPMAAPAEPVRLDVTFTEVPPAVARAIAQADRVMALTGAHSVEQTIVQRLAVALGFLPIKLGKVPSSRYAAVFYHIGVVRERLAGDFKIELHELGHAIDEWIGGWSKHFDRGAIHRELVSLGEPTSFKSYTHEKRRAEGVANFLPMWITDPERARMVAPNFAALWERWVRESGHPVAAAVAEGRSLYRALTTKPEEMSEEDWSAWLMDRLIQLDPAPDWLTTTLEAIVGRVTLWDKLIAAVADDQYRLRQMERQMHAGESIDPRESVYWLSRSLAGAPGRAESFIIGKIRLDDFTEIGPGLEEAYRPTLEAGGETAMTFIRALVARRLKRILATGGPSIWTKEQIQAALQRAEASPVVRQALETYDRHRDAFLSYLEHKRFIGPATRQRLELAWAGVYAPLGRVFESVDARLGGGGLAARMREHFRTPRFLRRYRGALTPVVNPIVTSMEDIFQGVAKAEENFAMLSLIRSIERIPGSGRWLQVVPPDRYKVVVPGAVVAQTVRRALERAGIAVTPEIEAAINQTITLWLPRTYQVAGRRYLTVRDGDRVVIAEIMDDALWEMLSHPVRWQSTLAWAFLAPARWAAALVKHTATLSPRWILRNLLVRDPMTLAMYHPLDQKREWLALWRAVPIALRNLAAWWKMQTAEWEQFQRSPQYQLYLHSMAAQSTYLSSSRNLYREYQRRLRRALAGAGRRMGMLAGYSMDVVSLWASVPAPEQATEAMNAEIRRALARDPQAVRQWLSQVVFHPYDWLRALFALLRFRQPTIAQARAMEALVAAIERMRLQAGTVGGLLDRWRRAREASELVTRLHLLERLEAQERERLAGARRIELDLDELELLRHAAANGLPLPRRIPRSPFPGAPEWVGPSGLSPQAVRYLMAHTRDTPQDFALMGRWIHELNHFIPFLGARIGGLTRLIREGRANTLRLAVRLLPYLGAAVLLRWINEDDDEYRTRSPIERAYYHHLPVPQALRDRGWGPFLVVPRPYDIGTVATALESMVAAAKGDPKWASGVAGGISVPEQLSGALPPTLSWGMEILANYQLWGDRPIVSPWDLALDPELQYNRWTPEWIKGLGRMTGWSPAKLDYTLTKFGTSLYKDANAVVDRALSLMGFTPPQPQRRLWQVPPITAFYFGSELGRHDLREFYEESRKLEGAADSVRQYWRQGDYARARERAIEMGLRIHSDGSVTSPLLTRYRRTETALRQLQREFDAIMGHKTLSPREKDLRLELLAERMVNLARQALGRPILVRTARRAATSPQ